MPLHLCSRSFPVLVILFMTAGAALAKDPIVGSWVGEAAQPEDKPFETRLTFVSPKGGISRYPSFPCGGMLEGGPKGDAYEYNESIIWGGPDEEANAGCIGGVMRLEVDGNKMKYEWKTTHDGQEFTASGELQRVK